MEKIRHGKREINKRAAVMNHLCQQLGQSSSTENRSSKKSKRNALNLTETLIQTKRLFHGTIFVRLKMLI